MENVVQLIKKVSNLFLILFASIILFGCSAEVEDKPKNPPQEPPVIVDAQYPKINSNLESQTVTSAVEFTLSVSAESTDGGKLSYQWYQATSQNDEGVLIEKATGSSYTNKITLGAEETEKNIFYYVIITNTIEDNGDGGTKIASLSSKRAKITINKKVNAKIPTIIIQPKEYEDVKPDSYELSVKAISSDDGVITYQWYKFVDIAADPMPIEGATSETYKLTEEELAENAENYFYCEITNSIPDNEDGGVKTQTVATDCVCVRILPRINASVPNIVSDLVSITVNSEKEFTLSVIAETSDKGNLSYKWYEASSESDEGTLLPDVINFSFTNTIVLQEQEAEKNIFYYVVITNTIEDNDDGGTKTASVISKRAKVTVNKKINAEVPTIITQPVGYEGTKVDSYELTVTAETSDSGTLSYQWYKATDSTSEGTIIEGETSKVYTLTEEELEENNANYFYCVVTNTITDNEDGGTKVQKVVSNRVCVNVFGGIGFSHPDAVSALPFSPVDSDDSADSYGWNSLDSKLGAIISGSETTFAVYSKNATKMLLEIYETAYGEDAKYDYWMEKGADNIWRAKLRDVPAGTLYAFRAWGPNWKFNQNWKRGNSNEGYVKDYDLVGNRFNPNKVLFDPYAKEISHDKSNPTALGSENGGMYGTGSETYSGTLRRNFDTGKYAPKAVVIDDDTSFGVKPAIPQENAIIYEAHARGITKHPSSANLSAILSGFEGFENVVDIPAEYQGTYKGAGMLAPYLKALGVNTIELLPVHESDNDANPVDEPGGNYWAYMTYGYFAPDRRYSSDKSYGGPTREFKEMVKAFHDAGMEVYLDVVFNHSGEGGPWYGTKDNYNTAELTFMRGLDNSTYYSLTADKKGYWETTGCGNNLQCDNAIVRNFILDSLTYWIDKMGVDGYRFDLAPVLGREKSGSEWVFRQNAKTINDIVALGNSKNAEMIAEAWDTQWPGGYQVGNFPSGWGEWNGRYRDAMRNFVGNGNWGQTGDYIYGDEANFKDQGGPHKSVNFIVAHDGFTLADLSSGYGQAGNDYNKSMTWPFGPSDGGNGDGAPSGFLANTTDEKASKRQANRNYTAIQMMSRGVPMIVWGDEFCRTQNGNNNPYNIDSVATWSNYNMINTDSPHSISTGGGGSYHNNFGTFKNAEDVNGNFVFMNYMLKLKAKEPALNQKNYSSVKYTYSSPSEYATSDVMIHIDGSAVSGGSDYILCMNMTGGEVKFALPKAASGKSWVRIVDTQSYFETELNCWNDETVDSVEISGQYGVAPWSVVILKEVAKRETVSNPKIVASGANANGDFSGSATVTITCDTTAASIYYTTDGSEPSAKNGTLYNGAIDVTNSVTIKAIALKAGCVPSAVVTKKLTNTSCVEIPVLSVPAGDFWNTITVFVTGATSGATYYYTTDGTEPDTSSSKYAASTGIKIDATTTLKVVGTKSGLANSSVVSAEYTKQVAQSYTENKSGVMLQGFNWDSAPRGEGFNAENPNPKWYKWYKTMKTYSDEIKNRFEYVWFPPASKTDTSSSEGYAPNELNNLNSCYGTEEELKAVVESIKPAKAIADIVVNHRSGTTSWGDFTNPKWNDDYYSICSDDEGFSLSGSPMLGSSKKGAADSGMAYAAYRDLDHTNAAVQQGIYSWMNSVLKRAGFVGWRYDYVKGFDGKYVGYYNAMTDAVFSVGEYWPDDGNWKTLINDWISATGNSVNGQAGKKSRAFDFVLKQNLNNAFGWYKATENGPDHSNDTEDNWNLALLADSSTLMRSNPSAAITFVDNHDTGSTQQHWELSWYDVPVAYAYILTHPGMPCVASQHYFAEDGWQYRGADTVPGTTKTMKEHIDYLIQLRQDLGIEYDDTVNVLASSKTNYVAKIAGTNGEIIVKIGGDAYTPTGTGYTGNYPIYSGTNFAIWQKGNAGVEPVKATYTITIPDDQMWIYDASAKIFAWVWGGTHGAGEWVSVSGTGTSLTLKADAMASGFLLVRCHSATTTPNWDVTEDGPGKIWNQTKDKNITSGQTSYSVTFN